jgi:hypothetical protein
MLKPVLDRILSNTLLDAFKLRQRKLKMQIKISGSGVMPFLIGTLLLFAGCATTMQSYEGSKLPPENVALIKGNFGVAKLATILEVDGKARGFFEEFAEVLPGEHTIKIQVSRGLGTTYIGTKTLSFQAIAGHTYVIDGTIIKGDTFAWIVDKTTDTIVAGERP